MWESEMRRLRTSVLFSAAFAAVYSLIVVGLHATDPGRFVNRGLSVGDLLLVYWAGALIAGALVGLLWPIARTSAGSALVGVLASFPLMYGIASLRADADTQGVAATAVDAAILALFLGGLGGTVLHYMLAGDRNG